MKIRDRTTSTAEIEMDVFETSLAAGHRVYASDEVGIDLFGGLRYWQIDTTVSYTLSGPVAGSANRRFEGRKSWVDPIVGARIELPIGESWFAGLLGDIGGFGIGSRLQWEAVARAGYRFSDSWALSGGYRHVTADFEDDGFLFDATLTGPFIALDINF